MQDGVHFNTRSLTNGENLEPGEELVNLSPVVGREGTTNRFAFSTARGTISEQKSAKLAQRWPQSAKSESDWADERVNGRGVKWVAQRARPASVRNWIEVLHQDQPEFGPTSSDLGTPERGANMAAIRL